MTTTQIIGKYRVESIDQYGKYFVKVFNTNAKKECNALKQYYSYRTPEARDKYIEDFKSRITSWDKMMSDRRAARLNFANPAKVGDVLCASWGYDQTNVDYYQVVRVMNKMVEIREIQQKPVDGSTYAHGMAEMVSPSKGQFRADGKTLRCKVGPSGYKEYSVKVSECASAYLVSENSKTYHSWYA